MADVHLSQPNVTSSSQATCTLQVVHHAYWNITFSSHGEINLNLKKMIAFVHAVAEVSLFH